MGEQAAFIILSIITLASAVVVVNSNNVVRAALALVPTFLGVTGLYIMLQAEFVAGIQVLIYAGAITVLILFVIMLTEGGTGLRIRQRNEQAPLGLLTAAALAAILISVLTRTEWPKSTATLPQYTASAIGNTFLTNSVLAFEVSSLVLLISLMGAIIIARREK